MLQFLTRLLNIIRQQWPQDSSVEKVPKIEDSASVDDQPVFSKDDATPMDRDENVSFHQGKPQVYSFIADTPSMTRCVPFFILDTTNIQDG